MEEAVWNSFVTVVQGLLGKKLCGACWNFGEELMHSGMQDVAQSLILNSNLDEFKENIEACLEEQGECYQDILDFERHFSDVSFSQWPLLCPNNQARGISW